MTTKERRQLHEWRRCCKCGRYVSYADLDSGRAKIVQDYPDPWGGESAPYAEHAFDCAREDVEA